jgi:hypothetical protein
VRGYNTEVSDGINIVAFWVVTFRWVTVLRRNTGAVYFTEIIETTYKMCSVCGLFWKIPEGRI